MGTPICLYPFLVTADFRLTYLPEAFSSQLRKDFQSACLIRFTPCPNSLAVKADLLVSIKAFISAVIIMAIRPLRKDDYGRPKLAVQ
jgi:hypothetical protein